MNFIIYESNTSLLYLGEIDDKGKEGMEEIC
jgi:hypothetical protein